MLYIIIPVHNRKKFTEGCLQSLSVQTFRDFKIVVVDDGSRDGTKEMIKSKFPNVKLLYGDGNLFWTAAINLGIQYALNQKADKILSLNDDTLAQEDFIEKMLYWSNQKPNSIIGTVALDTHTKKPVYGGARIDWKRNKSQKLLEELSTDQQVGLHEVTHFPGRGLLIPASVFQQIGLFDNKAFPHCTADYDFTHNAFRNGIKIYCNYDSKLFVFPEENGGFKSRQNKSFRGYFDHLFGMKGEGNLIYFSRFTSRYCPPLHMPYVLANGYIRRIFGYLIK